MWSHGPWDWFPWMWIFPLIFLVVMVLFLLRGPGWPMWDRHGMRGSGRQRAGNPRPTLRSRRNQPRGISSNEERPRITKDPRSV